MTLRCGYKTGKRLRAFFSVRRGGGGVVGTIRCYAKRLTFTHDRAAFIALQRQGASEKTR